MCAGWLSVMMVRSPATGAVKASPCLRRADAWPRRGRNNTACTNGGRFEPGGRAGGASTVTITNLYARIDGGHKYDRPVGHREQLLVAARQLLEDKGYAHITARDLVAASGTN